VSAHKAREMRDERVSRERKADIAERAGVLALLATILHSSNATDGSVSGAVSRAKHLLDEAERQATADVDAESPSPARSEER